MSATAQVLDPPAGTPGTHSVPAVELREVSKRYGEVEALRDVDLRVGVGEVVAVLGPNGAGKTTAIGFMLGLRLPTAGHVTILGGDPGSYAVRSRVGTMLQESGVPGTLKVSEVVDLFRSFARAWRERHAASAQQVGHIAADWGDLTDDKTEPSGAKLRPISPPYPTGVPTL